MFVVKTVFWVVTDFIYGLVGLSLWIYNVNYATPNAYIECIAYDSIAQKDANKAFILFNQTIFTYSW